MTKIGHAVASEEGTIYGKPGNQTGKELRIQEWYNTSWTHVIRPKDSKVAEKIAATMEACCKNMNIGYSQASGDNGRTSLYREASNHGWDISKIDTLCNTDCSACVSVCVNASGIKVSKDIYTGIELEVLKKTGAFTIYTDDKLKNPDKLKRGDILLKKGHTCVVLSNDSKKKDASLSGTYKTTASLNLRSGAGTSNKVLVVLPKGTKVTCYGYYTPVGETKWLYVDATVNGKKYTGFCSIKYLVK